MDVDELCGETFFQNFLFSQHLVQLTYVANCLCLLHKSLLGDLIIQKNILVYRYECLIKNLKNIFCIKMQKLTLQTLTMYTNLLTNLQMYFQEFLCINCVLTKRRCFVQCLKFLDSILTGSMCNRILSDCFMYNVCIKIMKVLDLCLDLISLNNFLIMCKSFCSYHIHFLNIFTNLCKYIQSGKILPQFSCF